jgi:hypothetical protein
MKGLFGDLFDFNRDGKLDWLERAAELIFLDKSSAGEDEDSGDDF